MKLTGRHYFTDICFQGTTSELNDCMWCLYMKKKFELEEKCVKVAVE